MRLVALGLVGGLIGAVMVGSWPAVVLCLAGVVVTTVWCVALSDSGVRPAGRHSGGAS